MTNDILINSMKDAFYSYMQDHLVVSKALDKDTENVALTLTNEYYNGVAYGLSLSMQVMDKYLDIRSLEPSRN